jgi:hypothetical protein
MEEFQMIDNNIWKLVLTETEYLEESKMKENLKLLEGVELDSEDENSFTIFDNYENFDRFITFYKKGKIPYNDLVYFGTNNINQINFINLLKQLSQLLLMNINKIIFINNENDYKMLQEWSPNNTLNLDTNVGMFVWNDGVTIINLYCINQLLDEEEPEEMQLFGYYNRSEHLQRSIMQTLLHELYHSFQHNPLFETLMPEGSKGENMIEEFCREDYKKYKVSLF